MVLLSRKQQIAIEIEAAEGTAETLVAADAGFNTFDVQFTPDIQQIERNPNRASIGNLPSIAGVRLGSVRFRTELVGSGNGADPTPPVDDLLQGCGFAKYEAAERIPLTSITGTFLPGEQVTDGTATATVVVGNLTEDAVYITASVGTFSTGTLTGAVSGATASFTAPAASNVKAYRPTSAGGESVTVGVYQDGRRHLLRGCRGNMQMRGAVGDVVSLEFEFIGALVSTTDTALLTGVSLPSLIPPQFLGTSLAFGAFSPVFETLELDMANDLAPRRSANDATGIISTRITARTPRGTIDPEAALIGGGGGQDFYNSLYAGTSFNGYFEVGSAAGNQFLVHAPKLQYGNVNAGDRNAILTDNIELRLNETTADDDIVIACL